MRRFSSPVSARLALLAAALHVTACRSEPIWEPRDGAASADLVGAAADLRVVAADLATTGDLAPDRCTQFTECQCLSLSSCRAIMEDCYCPYPQCGMGACGCGGGRYFGCAQPNCQPIPRCPRSGIVFRDGAACPACRDPQTCAEGFAALKASCGFSDAYLGAFQCVGNLACKLDCLKKVDRCEQVGCGLCITCRCPQPGAFEQCVGACPP